MKVPLSVAMVLFASASALLAACGGGGGNGGFSPIPTSAPSSPSGGGSEPSSNPSPSASPSTTTAPSASQAATSINKMPLGSSPYGQMTQTQQATAIASLAGTSGTLSGLLGTGPLVLAGRRLLSEAVSHRFASQACSNFESEYSTASSGGLVTYVVQGYPNTSCSGAPEFELQLAVMQQGTKGAASVPTYVGSGFESFQNPTTNVTLATNTISYVSISGSKTLMQGQFEASVGLTGSVTSAYGLSCTTSGCNAGTVINFNTNPATNPSIAFGTIINTSTGSTPIVATACAAYPNSLTLAFSQATSLYSINGCANDDDVQIAQSGSNSYSLIDSSVQAEVDVTTNSDGSVAGYVYSYANGSKSAKPLAQFSADKFGSGTLTTSDNTQTPLVDFMVI